MYAIAVPCINQHAGIAGVLRWTDSDLKRAARLRHGRVTTSVWSMNTDMGSKNHRMHLGRRPTGMVWDFWLGGSLLLYRENPVSANGYIYWKPSPL